MKRLLGAILLVLYLMVWGMQADKASWADYYLSPATPAPVLKVASGYARQLTAFALFVKVSIFAGGPLRGVDQLNYADTLAQNFDVMTDLYPEFIDPYHYCQSLLAPISSEYAGRANGILDRAVKSHPLLVYFPFFQAFNTFYYMQQPVKAAEMFFTLSTRPDAPPWFGHLAGMLMARGGNLVAGRSMLEAMLATEQDEFMKDRYRRSIGNFDQAIRVQAALDHYRQEHDTDATTLQELVPDYLDVLPILDDGFVLVWEPPLLRLDRF